MKLEIEINMDDALYECGEYYTLDEKFREKVLDEIVKKIVGRVERESLNCLTDILDDRLQAMASDAVLKGIETKLTEDYYKNHLDAALSKELKYQPYTSWSSTNKFTSTIRAYSENVAKEVCKQIDDKIRLDVAKRCEESCLEYLKNYFQKKMSAV